MNEERKARLNQIREKLKNLSEEEKKKLLDNGLIATIEGRFLSPRNTMMVYLQCPDNIPTVVGGFKQWKAAGRVVMKGQHGMSILFPIGPKVETEDGESVEPEYFSVATVFDILQTEEIEVLETVS